MAMFGRDAFRVELHTMDGQAFMTKAHYMPIIAACIDDEASWNVFHDQRVIARGGKGRGQARKQPRAIMRYGRCFPCISPPRTTVPPKYWPMDWWPRHTPSNGFPAAAQAPTKSSEMPASLGVQGPGEMRNALAPLRRAWSAVNASLRTTCVSAPNSIK